MSVQLRTHSLFVSRMACVYYLRAVDRQGYHPVLPLNQGRVAGLAARIGAGLTNFS
jgi:hypothetical protein